MSESAALKQIAPRPSLWRVCRAIGWVTFLEIIRDKVLYNIVLFAILLFGAGFLASRLTFVRPDRVILDFGVSAVNVSSMIIAIFVGSSVLGREFERRTIYVALSRPISRFHFILGKFYGIVNVIAVNWLLLCGAFCLILGLSGGGNDFAPTLFYALLLILLQSVVLASAAILVSTISTTSLSAIITFGIYLIGNNISQLRLISVKLRNETAGIGLNILSGFLPDLEYFNLGTKVTYGLPVTAEFVAGAIVYATFLTALMLTCSGLLIQGKES